MIALIKENLMLTEKLSSLNTQILTKLDEYIKGGDNMQEKPICCFCGKECENEFGNNPYPANKDEDARCCDDCNTTVVIPARLEELED